MSLLWAWRSTARSHTESTEYFPPSFFWAFSSSFLGGAEKRGERTEREGEKGRQSHRRIFKSRKREKRSQFGDKRIGRARFGGSGGVSFLLHSVPKNQIFVSLYFHLEQASPHLLPFV